MRRRDDNGAVAILVALLMVVLLSMCAMAVDLGHAYAQKRDVQKDTDFAALAGVAGSNLPGTTVGTCGYGPRAAATDQAVQDVAEYLASEPAAPDLWPETPSAAGLVDCSLTNGEALYGTVTWNDAGGITLTHDPYLLTVVSPRRLVDFGFAP